MNFLNKGYKNKKPLVLHIVTSLDFGGIEKYVEVLSEVLDKANMCHIFLAIGSGGATADILRKNGIEVICLEGSAKIPSFFSISRLVRLIHMRQPLVVHTHGAEGNFHGLLASLIARVPICIGEEVGIPSHSRKAKFIFRQIYRISDKVIGVSNTVSSWLCSSGEVPERKVVTLYNPVKLPTVRGDAAACLEKVLRVCYVGRLEFVKNPLVLVEVARKLRDQGIPIEVWIVGDGTQRQQIEQKINEYDLLKIIKLFGYQADPAYLIRQSSIFVQPSLSEGFSLALVEAMGCGVPVAVTRVGGAVELVDQDITGWLLDDPSEKALLEVLIKAWQVGPQKLFEMGQRARQSVEGRFEPANYLAQLEKMYAQVAEERGINII